jgi:3-hydroxy-3-methylglutaryl CoA synthase
MRHIAYALIGLIMALATAVAFGSPSQAATAGGPGATALTLSQDGLAQKVYYYRYYYHNRYRSHWRWGSHHHRYYHHYYYRPHYYHNYHHHYRHWH